MRAMARSAPIFPPARRQPLFRPGIRSEKVATSMTPAANPREMEMSLPVFFPAPNTDRAPTRVAMPAKNAYSIESSALFMMNSLKYVG